MLTRAGVGAGATAVLLTDTEALPRPQLAAVLAALTSLRRTSVPIAAVLALSTSPALLLPQLPAAVAGALAPHVVRLPAPRPAMDAALQELQVWTLRSCGQAHAFDEGLGCCRHWCSCPACFTVLWPGSALPMLSLHEFFMRNWPVLTSRTQRRQATGAVRPLCAAACCGLRAPLSSSSTLRRRSLSSFLAPLRFAVPAAGRLHRVLPPRSPQLTAKPQLRQRWMRARRRSLET